MKKIKIFFILKNDDPDIIFWKQNKNSKFFYRDNKIYFNSLYDSLPVECRIKCYNLNLDESLLQSLITIIHLAHKEAMSLSGEPIMCNLESYEKIISILNTTIYEFLYKEENCSIFNFVAKIFIKLLMFHPLSNGNKRFSIAYISLLLNFMGYYLKWTGGEWINYKFYENKISEFVSKLSNIEISDINEINEKNLKVEKDIIKWLIQNTIISYK